MRHRFRLLSWAPAPAQPKFSRRVTRKLISTRNREAEDTADKDGEFAVGFKVSFDHSAPPTKLKVTCCIAKTISDGRA